MLRAHQKRIEYSQRFTRVSLLAWRFVAFHVLRTLEGAGLISVALVRGNGYHSRHPPRKN